MIFASGFAALVLSASACRDDAAAPAQVDGAAPAGPTASAAPSGDAVEQPAVAEDGHVVSAVDWFEGELDDALAKAASEDKGVLLDVGAYWCPPCHRLDEELFVLPEIGDFLRRGYVAMHVDAEQGAGPDLVDRYDVQAYPTMLVLDAAGVEKGRIVDFVEAPAFLTAMERISKGENVLAELEAAAAAAPEDLEAAYAAGHAYAIAAERTQAETHFARVLEGDAEDAAGLASKVLYDRAMFFAAKLDKDPEAAIAGYRELQARYPKSSSAITAYRQIGRQLCKLGRPEEARASLDAMLATAPKDSALRSAYGWFAFRQRCVTARGLEVVLEGLEAAPKDAGLHYLAAELSLQSGDRAAAQKHIEAAVELEPKRGYYRRRRAALRQAPGPKAAP